MVTVAVVVVVGVGVMAEMAEMGVTVGMVVETREMRVVAPPTGVALAAVQGAVREAVRLVVVAKVVALVVALVTVLVKVLVLVRAILGRGPLLLLRPHLKHRGPVVLVVAGSMSRVFRGTLDHHLGHQGRPIRALLPLRLGYRTIRTILAEHTVGMDRGRSLVALPG